MNLDAFGEKIGFSPTFDTLSILFLLLTAFFYGISIGRKRMITILLATYVSFAIWSVLPFFDKLAGKISEANFFFLSAIGFSLSTVITYLLLSGSKVRSLVILRATGVGSWWQIFILSVLQVGLLVSIVLSFFPRGLNIELTPITTNIFMHQVSRFFWFVIPIVILGLLKRNEKGGNH